MSMGLMRSGHVCAINDGSAARSVSAAPMSRDLSGSSYNTRSQQPRERSGNPGIPAFCSSPLRHIASERARKTWCDRDSQPLIASRCTRSESIPSPVLATINGAALCCRLVLTATVLAAKFLDDEYYTNRHYAKVGGVSLAELNSLEMHMLTLLAYRLRVSTTDLQWHLRQVRSLPGGPNVLDAEPSRSGCPAGVGAYLEIPAGSNIPSSPDRLKRMWR